MLSALVVALRSLALICGGHRAIALENLAVPTRKSVCLPICAFRRRDLNALRGVSWLCRSAGADVAANPRARWLKRCDKLRVSRLSRPSREVEVGGVPSVNAGSWAWSGNKRSGRAAFVTTMEATDVRDRHDGTLAGRRDRTRNRRVLIQRQVLNKSTANRLCWWARTNSRHVVSRRFPAGPRPAARSHARTVVAETVMPRPFNSPTIRG